MRMYYCRKRDNPAQLMGRLLSTGDGYVTTDTIEEVHFIQNPIDAGEVVSRYPELEVCCLDASPVPVSYSESPELQIANSDSLDISIALRKFKDALCDLQRVVPVCYSAKVDTDATVEIFDVHYDKETDRLYLEVAHTGAEH